MEKWTCLKSTIEHCFFTLHGSFENALKEMKIFHLEVRVYREQIYHKKEIIDENLVNLGDESYS